MAKPITIKDYLNGFLSKSDEQAISTALKEGYGTFEKEEKSTMSKSKKVYDWIISNFRQEMWNGHGHKIKGVTYNSENNNSNLTISDMSGSSITFNEENIIDVSVDEDDDLWIVYTDNGVQKEYIISLDEIQVVDEEIASTQEDNNTSEKTNQTNQVEKTEKIEDAFGVMTDAVIVKGNDKVQDYIKKMAGKPLYMIYIRNTNDEISSRNNVLRDSEEKIRALVVNNKVLAENVEPSVLTISDADKVTLWKPTWADENNSDVCVVGGAADRLMIFNYLEHPVGILSAILENYKNFLNIFDENCKPINTDNVKNWNQKFEEKNLHDILKTIKNDVLNGKVDYEDGEAQITKEEIKQLVEDTDKLLDEIKKNREHNDSLETADSIMKTLANALGIGNVERVENVENGETGEDEREDEIENNDIILVRDDSDVNNETEEDFNSPFRLMAEHMIEEEIDEVLFYRDEDGNVQCDVRLRSVYKKKN